MPELHRTIVAPVVTEKSSASYAARKEYAFRVRPDATKPQRRFDLCARISDDVDRSRRIEKRACPRCVLPAEADVDAAGQVRRGEIVRIACVEHLAADLLYRESLKSEPC